MAKFRITGPDGASYEVTAPDGANEQDVLSYAQQQFGGGAKQPAGPKAKAPSSGIVMGWRDPVDAGAQMLRRLVPEGAARAVDTFGNWLADKGFPVERSDGVAGVDKIVQEVNQGYDQKRKERGGDGFDGARLVGNLANPANYVGGGSVAAARTIPQLALAGARAGGASAVFQPVTEGTDDFWTKKAGQAGMGAVAGAILTPAVSKVAEKGARAVGGMMERARPAPTDREIRIAVNNTFVSQGMTPADVPEAVLQSVRRQVDEAMREGRRLNPQEMVRRAQFEAVGLAGDAAPTAGQLSRNPTQYANEVNLAQTRIRTPQGEGNPLADRFNTQNRRLQEVFDQAGAREATDRITAGQSMMDALRQADQPVRAGVDDAYAAARAMSGGRMVDLDRATFSQNVNRVLDEQMLGGHLPPEIRNTINEIAAGQKVLGHHGPTVDVPFNVQVAEVWDSVLSKAQRKYGQGTPEAYAIGVVRRSLHETPFMPAAQDAGETAAAAAARTVDDLNAPIVDVPFRPAGGPQRALPPPQGGAVSFQIPQPQPGAAGAAVDEGAAAREAFAQARRAARDRFATIEATPALRAALDQEAPDKFVQNFILNADVRDVQAMRGVLGNSPEALAQARAQIADHLKRAAFGSNMSGDKVFAPERYEKTLRALGRQKLEVFFSPAEIVRMNLAARVASDINSVPAGARPNFSGTGGALMNLLSGITESPMVRQIPGVRLLANQIGEIRTEQAINQALRPTPAQPARELSPEAVRALQFLLPAAGVSGGVLGGSAVN